MILGNMFTQKIISSLQTVANWVGYDMPVDGIMGSKTAEFMVFLDRADEVYRASVLDVIGMPEIAWQTQCVKYSNVARMINTVAAGDSVAIKFLSEAVKLEGLWTDGTHFIDPEGKHVGIFQFDVATWKSVVDLHPAYRLDPYSSVVAAYELYKKNKKYHMANHPEIPFSWELAYIYHNQGASATSKYLKQGKLAYFKQSKVVLNMAENLWKNLTT